VAQDKAGQGLPWTTLDYLGRPWANLVRGDAYQVIGTMKRTNKDNGMKKADNRQVRLAGALRENLRRRKAQERARTESQPAGTTDELHPAGVGSRLR